MAEDVKRVHYFDQQFLREEDFADEQEYHIRLRREHNRQLHSWGIVFGLDLKLPSPRNLSRVAVGAGMAIDSLGQEIVLVEDTETVDLSSVAGRIAYITIAYHEEETDSTTETGVTGNTRWTERPMIQVNVNPPTDASLTLILGRVIVNAAGEITWFDPGIAPNRRRKLPSVSSDMELSSLTLVKPTVIPEKWAHLTLGAENQADLSCDLSVQGKIDVTGKVDGRDVSADGDTLDHHIMIDSTHPGNPHGTTADQVGALPITGGTVKKLATDFNKHLPPLTVLSEASNSLGGLRAGVAVEPITSWHRAALCGQSQLELVNGVAASNTVSTGRALSVLGLAYFAPLVGGGKALHVTGTAYFEGSKGGYVTDIFVNGSGHRLRTGDIVKLKSTPVTRFHGNNNKIPVAVVSLSDMENDSAVIGIVDGEAIPMPDAPDRRVEPNDPTFIEDGGELLVVTLGVYAHCKVDATEAPIAVGDLLTTSANPGHARKATDPKIGCIIGKALEPLTEGTGYIAVFVNIQ